MAPTTRSKKTVVKEEKIKGEKISGIIKNFITYRGFGFLTADDEPDTEVFVYLKNLVGYEGKEYPFFAKGTPVEFIKVKDAKGWSAQEVSQPGGAKLVSVTEDPSKNYNMNMLYTGTVHFFNYRAGFGFITCDVESIEWGGKTSESKMGKYIKEEGEEPVERLAASLWFAAEEIVGEKDVRKKLCVGDKVQFNVYIDEKGLGAGKVLLLEAAGTLKRKGDWIIIGPKGRRRKKKRKSVKEVAEMDTYLNKNFRGALQVYFQQIGGITTVYDTVKNDNDLFFTTVRNIGHKDYLIKGTGSAAVKKASIQAAALDLIFKLDLVSKEQHKELHNVDSD